MSRITLVLGSLIVGVVLGALFFGNYTVTLAQPLAVAGGPQNPPPISGGTIDCAGVPGCVSLGLHSEPTIPGLARPVADMGFVHGTQPLDGLDCNNCAFKDETIRYSGGAVRLIGPKFEGEIKIELSGAAANTLSLMPMFAAIAAGQKPEPPNPNRPVLKTVSIKTPITVREWATPFK